MEFFKVRERSKKLIGLNTYEMIVKRRNIDRSYTTIIVFHFVDIYLVPVSYVKFQSKSLHTFQFLAESQNLVLMDVLQQVDFLLSPAIENYKKISY